MSFTSKTSNLLGVVILATFFSSVAYASAKMYMTIEADQDSTLPKNWDISFGPETAGCIKVVGPSSGKIKEVGSIETSVVHEAKDYPCNRNQQFEYYLTIGNTKFTIYCSNAWSKCFLHGPKEGNDAKLVGANYSPPVDHYVVFKIK